MILYSSLQTVMKNVNNSIVAKIASFYMRLLGEGLFTTRTVGELLWGYEDKLMKAIKHIQPHLDDVFGLFYKVSFKAMC